MRIALITTTFLPGIGGAEFVVHHLANQWCRQGHDVCVMNLAVDKTTQPDSLYTVRQYRQLRGSNRLGSHRFPFTWYCARQLERFLKEYKPDFISVHFAYPVAIWMNCMNPVPKYLVTCHGPAISEAKNSTRNRYNIDGLLANSMNCSAGVIAISSYARRILESMGVLSHKIFDIPNGVDCKSFRKKSDFNLRGRLGIPPKALVILSVGREAANGAKAYDVGIRAFAKIANRRKDLYYVILGKGTEKWISLVEKLGLSNRVVLCEGMYGDELIGAYQQSDIFFSPSAWELCPLVVLEAMAAGLPQVVTNVSGSHDMVINGINGIVVEPNQPDQMANALYDLLQHNNMRNRIKVANLERAQCYDWNNISQRYLELA